MQLYLSVALALTLLTYSTDAFIPTLSNLVRIIFSIDKFLSYFINSD